jgi:diguanylate cyclase (GGDEF)-like protein/PAS domain S-box-containing protein
VPIREIALAFGVFLADCIAFWLTRAASGVALFWPGCAIAACALIRFRRVRWVAAALTLFLAVGLANMLAAHRPPALAFAFGALNLAEVALMVGAFRLLWVYPYPDISIGQAAIMTGLGGIAVPGLCALLGALIMGLYFRAPSSVVVLEAWSSHAMGACLLGPPLILASTAGLRRLARARFVAANILTLVFCLTGAYLCIRYVRFPFVSVSLFLLLASFRVGGFGTSLCSLAVGFLIGDLWVLGIRPLGLEHVPVTGTLVDLPVVAFLATLLPPIAVGIGNDARRIATRALRASLDERKSAEAKLAAERERLRVTLGAIADAVVTTDVDSQIQYVNPAAEGLLGIPEAAALGRRIGDVIHLVNPETQRRAPSLILQTTMHGTTVRRDRPCLLHRSDGSVCYVLDSISPVLGEAGQVTGLVMVLQDATGEVARTRDLEVRARQDQVTGLANRSELELRLRKCFDRARHLGVPAALVAIDLDRFKVVNDTGGHAVGDEMLKRVAETCRLHVRASDTIARLGGDEFALILDNCTAEQARLIGEQLLRALNPLALEREGVSFVIGASIGIAMIQAQTASPEEWLKAADSACYRAKQAGRGMLELDRG